VNPVSRLAGALRQHRGTLPWVLLCKMLPAGCKVETLILLRQSLQLPRSVPLPHLAAIHIQQLHSPCDPLLRQLCGSWPAKTFAARLLTPGRYCWVALQGERIVGYVWVACFALPIDEIGWNYDPVPGECYIHDCFVEPDCRGAGLYPYLLARVLQDCKRPEFLLHSGLNSALHSAAIGVIATNRASLRGIRKAGFAEYARIRHLQCGGRRWWWWRPARAVSGPAIQVKC
jgi:GNAT superfamily N-acetyltransferase